jgi:undecaprenyl-diphosphatase
MIRRRARGFLARRLSSEEYLGLHLTVGLLLCLLLVGAFGLIAHDVVGERELTDFDRTVCADCAAHRQEEPALRRLLVFVTEVGSPEAMIGLTVLVALGLLLRRRRRLALVWLLAMIGTGLLNLALKNTFDRPRPPEALRDAHINETTYSFPSGHSMGAVVAYGLLAYFLVLLLRRRRARVAVVALFAALALLVGFSRVYLAAHYFSDVVGGFAVGGAWLCACISGLEVARRRARHHRRPAHDPPPGPKPG